MSSRRSLEIQRRLDAALQAFEAGDCERATTQLRGALEVDPKDPNAHQLLSVVLFQLGREVEAITHLEESLAIAPANGDAWLNLGNMVASRDRSKAEQAFRTALEFAPNLVPARGCLASMYVDDGRYAEAAIELRALLAFAPDDGSALRLLAKSLRETRDFAGAVDVALHAFRTTPDERLRAAISRTYFLWFDSVDTNPAAARPVLEAWLGFDPADPVAKHMHAALTGADAPARASDAFVQQHFDEFAPTFDEVLGRLEYRAPEQVAEQIARIFPKPSASLAIVDLGCGTGRCGPLVRAWAAHLVGVDLSEKMLERAERLGVYDVLVQRELTGYLDDKEAAFDLAFAADTFIYFGPLEEVFAATFRALVPGGVFVAGFELLGGGDEDAFRLHTGGRFAHREDYVRSRLREAGFEVLDVVAKTLRLNYLEPVCGIIASARKPGGVVPSSQR